MCDPEQLNDVSRQASHFERDLSGGQYETLAVKRFQRSDAGKEMNNPDNIRPPVVLNLTMKYLREVLVDQDLVAPGQSYFEYMNQSYGEVADVT
jgi:hypothetical protein